jgi:pimeloyl-ACP methyl ester carboxylesterase
MRYLATIYRYLAVVLCWCPCHTALEHCSEELGGGVCPTGNTCCLLDDSSSGLSSSCIPSDLGAIHATCCSTDHGKTGCAVGYECRSTSSHDYCLAGDSVSDELVQRLPRYHLCHSSELTHVHGFPMQPQAKLPYYSSHGDITRGSSSIRMAVVVVHGSARNADDYFCTLTSVAQRQSEWTSPVDSVLVVAPRFAVATDLDVDNLVEGGTAILWNGTDPFGPWRYGASAVDPPSIVPTRFSSFEGMDRIATTLLDTALYPQLQRVTIVGHSSGGQFVQRWALMTSIWNQSNQDRLRAVVANPSSYAYFTPLRWIQNSWRYPPPTMNCSNYDEWNGDSLKPTNSIRFRTCSPW